MRPQTREIPGSIGYLKPYALLPYAGFLPTRAIPAVGLVRYGLEAGGFEALAEQVEKRVASVYDRQIQEELTALSGLLLVHDAQ